MYANLRSTWWCQSTFVCIKGLYLYTFSLGHWLPYVGEVFAFLTVQIMFFKASSVHNEQPCVGWKIEGCKAFLCCCFLAIWPCRDGYSLQGCSKPGGEQLCTCCVPPCSCNCSCCSFCSDSGQVSFWLDLISLNFMQTQNTYFRKSGSDWTGVWFCCTEKLGQRWLFQSSSR